MFQAIVNVFYFNVTPLDSAGATRLHHQLLPPDLVTMSISRPLPKKTISALGNCVEPHSWELGDVQVIWGGGGELRPAADPRDRGVGEIVAIE